MTNVDSRLGGAGLPEGFLDVAELVYERDPMWIPEESHEVRWAFGAENPWFVRNAAISLCAPGKARVAGFKDAAARIDGEEVAYFGYFETTGADPTAEGELFEQLITWARAQGAKALYGPIDFSTYSRNRLRLQTEPEALTHQGEPYNPPYYANILERLGFAPYWNYVTQMISFAGIKPLLDQDAERTASLKKRGFRFETINRDLWNDKLPQLHTLADGVFGNNLAYTPLSWPVFQHYCGESLIKAACTQTSVICFDPRGQIAGFFLNYPHYGRLVTAQAGSARVPVGQLDYATHWPVLANSSPRVLLGKTLGVSPQFQGQGIMRAIVSNSLSRMEGYYDQLFGTLIRDGNWSQQYLGALELPRRLYALYHRSL